MKKLIMQYGGVQDESPVSRGFELVDSGEVTDSTVVTLTFDVGGMYLLFCKEFNVSTGARRGERLVIINAPEEGLYGSTDIVRYNIHASSSAGVSLTNNSDSTLSINQSSSAYGFRYALYKAL